MTHILTQEELDQKCREWQEILRLQGWDITVEIVRVNNLPEDIDGQNNYTISRHRAQIKILDSVDYLDRNIDQDMEVDLVHELLHLHYCLFADLKEDSLEKFMMERSINYIAEALVRLKRNEQKENINRDSQGNIETAR